MNTLRLLVIACLGWVLLELSSANFIYAQLNYSGGLQYSNGTYLFTDRTQSFYFTNGLTLSGDRGYLSFSVPYVMQNTPWVSYSPAGGVPTGGERHGEVGGDTTASGSHQMDRRQQRRITLPDSDIRIKSSFSDPSISGSAYLYRPANLRTSVAMNGSVKIPLANPESGFGTGAWDYGGGISIFQGFRTWFLSADLMYWRLGDMDELNLNNPLTYGLGGGKSFKDGSWMISTIVSGSTRILDDYDPPMNLGFGIGHFFSRRSSLSGSLSIGLSETSPDVSAGIGWSFRLRGRS